MSARELLPGHFATNTRVRQVGKSRDEDFLTVITRVEGANQAANFAPGGVEEC